MSSQKRDDWSAFAELQSQVASRSRCLMLSLFEKCGFRSLPTVLWVIALTNCCAELATVGWKQRVLRCGLSEE